MAVLMFKTKEPATDTSDLVMRILKYFNLSAIARQYKHDLFSAIKQKENIPIIKERMH